MAVSFPLILILSTSQLVDNIKDTRFPPYTQAVVDPLEDFLYFQLYILFISRHIPYLSNSFMESGPRACFI